LVAPGKSLGRDQAAIVSDTDSTPGAAAWKTSMSTHRPNEWQRNTHENSTMTHFSAIP
jgi:hypothetical protein